MPLLEVQNLKTYFPLRGGRKGEVVRAVDDVSFSIREGEIFGLVGESGCGKSTLGRSILQLIRPTAGKVVYAGTDLTATSPAQLRRLRRQFQIVFQDPYSSLNPRMMVYDAIAEPLVAHRIVPRKEVPREVARLMEQVELAPHFARKYPHEFSGGQRQRIAIARALAMGPRFLIADEPVSALDVSVQAGILNLFSRLCQERQLTILFISHDLAVVRHLADCIAVMYKGKIVETGSPEEIFENPKEDYTKSLIAAIPVAEPIGYS